MTKLEYILDIKKRIDSEYKKHNNLDWAEIAANKIYASFISDLKQQIKDLEWEIDNPEI